MKKERKCNCLLAALTAIVTILLISFVTGYTMKNWTLTTWLAAAVIVVIAVFCIWCGRENDVEDDK